VLAPFRFNQRTETISSLLLIHVRRAVFLRAYSVNGRLKTYTTVFGRKKISRRSLVRQQPEIHQGEIRDTLAATLRALGARGLWDGGSEP
jgi:hypothetical protein